ncbi:MAG: glycosyltransferase family 4 protein, partial [Wenzhouxiangella sp.]
HPDIRLTGSLPSLTGALSLADLAVVPLISGGGTRMKILDYFAAGVPVISTAKGCEGLPLSDGRELLIRDDWDAFAESAAHLLQHPDQGRALAERATAFVEKLDWLEIGRRYEHLFLRMARQPLVGGP